MGDAARELRDDGWDVYTWRMWECSRSRTSGLRSLAPVRAVDIFFTDVVRALDVKLAVLKVDVAPAERREFAATEARVERGGPEEATALGRERVDQCGGVLGRDDLDALRAVCACTCRRLTSPRRIAPKSSRTERSKLS